jgi:23S rRNA pseudoU1915 N3-methylase RlmH
MSADEKPPMPPQPVTVPIPVDEIHAELARRRAAANEAIVTFQEVAEIKERLEKHSDGLTTASQHDATLAAQLAEEIVARQQLAKKVDALLTSQGLQTAILQRVDRFFDLCDRVRQHRLTKLVLALLTLAAAGYATSKGISK